MAIKLNLEDYTGNSRQAKVNDTVPIERLIRAAVTTLQLPSKDAEGQPITYRLRDKDRYLPEDKTLESQNIRQGDTIAIVPTFISKPYISDINRQGKLDTSGSFAFLSKAAIVQSSEPGLMMKQTTIRLAGNNASLVSPVLSVDGNEPARMPLDSTALIAQLISAITARLRLLSVDAEGRPITYYLRHNGRLLRADETLEEIGITNNDALTIERQLPDVSSSGFGDGGASRGLIARDVSEYVLISYHYADFAWASHIAIQLRTDPGRSIMMFDCDISEDEKFSTKMRTAMETAEAADQIIAVLSRKYLQSQLAGVQISVAADRDPGGEQGLLLPVYVEDCSSELVRK
jgi:uncharacterized ubiquitin-like protein YukD